MSEQDDFSMDFEGEQLTLADLAGADFGDIEEYHYERMPKLKGQFKVLESALTVVGTGDKKAPGFQVKAELVNVFSVAEKEHKGKEDELIGKTHTETIRFGDLRKGLGSAKAFIGDTGFVPSDAAAKLGDVVAEFSESEHIFNGEIIHNVDRNNTDIVYVHFNMLKGKITPAANPSEQQAA